MTNRYYVRCPWCLGVSTVETPYPGRLHAIKAMRSHAGREKALAAILSVTT